MVVVRNTRTGEIIAQEVGVASSFLSRLRGLMFSMPKDLVLVSPYKGINSSSIHMAFMKYSIDAVWLDENKKVISIRKNIPPLCLLKPSTWKTYGPDKPAKYVLELGRSRLKTEGDVVVGDVLEF